MKVNDEIEQAFREGYEMGHGDKSRQAEMIKEIANHYGFTSQRKITLEELLELGLAIMKLERGWSEDRYHNLHEEVADVLIMALQMRYMLGTDKIDEIINDKLVRQLDRIDHEEQG